MNRVLRPFPRLLHAGLSSALLWTVSTVALHPRAAFADVATKGGERPKKDPEDKKKDKRFDFLPEARPGTATFVAGTSVDIELAASVGSLRSVEFIIRQQPANGTLSAIRPHPRETNKAIVTYTHRGPDAPLADSFSYACRLDGAEWSASANIVLNGSRREPRIEVVNAPQFGRVFLGSQATARVFLRNTGEADFKSDLKWPEPFIGPSHLEVLRGSTAEFEVMARPTRTGEFRHDLVFQPGQLSARAIFYVECLKPFSVTPSQLSLQLEERTGERSAVLALANSRNTPVRVSIKHPDRLQAAEEVEVASGSRTDMRVALAAGDVDGFSGELIIMAGEDVETVPVEAKPKPPVLQILVPASLALDFGAVQQSAPASREVVLSNAGGESLILQASTRPPYKVDQLAGSLRIEPKAQARFKVILQTEQLGAVPGELDLNVGSFRAKIALSADVQQNAAMKEPANPGLTGSPTGKGTLAGLSPEQASAAQAATAGSAAATAPDADMIPQNIFEGRSKQQAALLAYIAEKGLPMPKDKVNPFLERITSLDLVSKSRNDAVLAWPRPGVMPSGWVVEKAGQTLNPTTGLIIKTWSRYKQWEPTEVDGDRIGMRILGLEPSTVYEFRVMGVDREGKVAEPTVSMRVETDEPWRLSPWFWRLLMLGLASAAGYYLYRLRRGDFGGPSRWNSPAQSLADAQSEALAESMAAIQKTGSTAEASA